LRRSRRLGRDVDLIEELVVRPIIVEGGVPVF
jgi:hypothetical protein